MINRVSGAAISDYGFAGAVGFAGAGVEDGFAAAGALVMGLKSVHLMTIRTGISWPFCVSVPSERE